jgi:glutaredoxin
MKNFIKVLALATMLSSLVYANSMDEMIIDFEESRVSKNPNLKLLDIEINTKKSLPHGWYGYILDVTLEIAGKKRVIKDTLFTDGKFITPELLDAKNGRTFKDLVTIDLSDKYYDKSKLLLGNHNAKNKIVIFSDPLCPFCKRYVPEVMNNLEKHSNQVAMYYYHFPLLRIHPAAGPLSKIMEVAKHKNVKDLELRVYKTDWEKYFSPKENNPEVILEAFNKVFNTKISISEITSSKLERTIQKDIKMGENVMVQGTPTIFINGKQDNTKLEYLNLGK